MNYTKRELLMRLDEFQQNRIIELEAEVDRLRADLRAAASAKLPEIPKIPKITMDDPTTWEDPCWAEFSVGDHACAIKLVCTMDGGSAVRHYAELKAALLGLTP